MKGNVGIQQMEYPLSWDVHPLVLSGGLSSTSLPAQSTEVGQRLSHPPARGRQVYLLKAR